LKIIVLGGEGMLGHKVYQTLLDRYPDTACTVSLPLSEPLYQRVTLFRQGRIFENVEAMDLQLLGNFLREWKPAFIVNCIGIVKQREEARAFIPSITLNALLPHKLADFAGAWGGKVIHFSTDCVFSGKRGKYTEEDPSDADDLYGRCKFLGEVVAGNTLTLRTSIIGRELANFRSLLEWFLAPKGNIVHGYRRVIYSGVTTNHLAQIVGNLVADHPTLSGLFQVTAPAISKYDLLCRLKEAYRLDVEIVPDDQEISDRSMVGEKFLRATGYRLPNWDDLVSQLVNDPTPYEAWR